VVAAGLNVPGAPYQALPCTDGQDLHAASRVTKPVSVSSAIVGSGNSSNGLWSDTGTSSGRGAYGKVQVKAHAQNTGVGDGFTRDGHETFARFDDTLTFTNGNGASVAHLVFSTTGRIALPHGEADLEFVTWINNAPSYTSQTRLVNNGIEFSLRNDGDYVNLVPPLPPTVRVIQNGYALKKLLAHVDVPFTYGAPAAVRALLWGYVAGSGSGSGISDLAGATTLTSITVDGNPHPVIASGSGTVYPTP
jgi:hypothetical protein